MAGTGTRQASGSIPALPSSIPALPSFNRSNPIHLGHFIWETI